MCVTHISKVEGDLQVAPKVVRELRVHVQDLQHILSVDLVQVTVGQGPHVSVGLSWPSVQVDGFTEYIVLTCGKKTRAGGLTIFTK